MMLSSNSDGETIFGFPRIEDQVEMKHHPARIRQAVLGGDSQKRPRKEVETTDCKGQNVKYAGVAVTELLQKAGTAHGETLRGEWLRAFVTVEAHDEYRAVFALPEFDADFTDRVILLAYERDGQPLDAQTGPFQIIVPGEKKHARSVRMVKEVRVLDSAWIKD